MATRAGDSLLGKEDAQYRDTRGTTWRREAQRRDCEGRQSSHHEKVSGMCGYRRLTPRALAWERRRSFRVTGGKETIVGTVGDRIASCRWCEFPRDGSAFSVERSQVTVAVSMAAGARAECGQRVPCVIGLQMRQTSE